MKTVATQHLSIPTDTQYCLQSVRLRMTSWRRCRRRWKAPYRVPRK